MCAKSYEYHYIQRLRPDSTSGALLFGSALDVALNVLLTDPNQSPEEIFDDAFTYQDINKVRTFLPTSPKVLYANTDADADLLSKEDIEQLKAAYECEDYLQYFTGLKKRKSDSGFDSLTDKEKGRYNLLNWLCMKRKAYLMLDAYRTKVMPKLTKVHKVQFQIGLDNGCGDEVTGYVDLVADVEGHGTVILDNKTSAMEYEQDSVKLSPQLALYTHALESEYNTRKAGFIVLRKQVIKNRVKICSVCGNDGTGGRHDTCNAMTGKVRCHGAWNETIKPEIGVQIIIDTIPRELESMVLQNIDDVNLSIKNNIFTRNLNACSNWYGSKCSYFDKCYNNKDKGLSKI
jgi:hypothetical protein